MSQSEIAKTAAPIIAMAAINGGVGALISGAPTALLIVYVVVWCPLTGGAAGMVGYRWANPPPPPSIWQRRPQG